MVGPYTISHDLPRHGRPIHDLPRSPTISHDMVGPSIDSSRSRSLLGLERGENLLVSLYLPRSPTICHYLVVSL